MASYEQLIEGARKADAAGDAAGARRFLELAAETKRATPRSSREEIAAGMEARGLTKSPDRSAADAAAEADLNAGLAEGFVQENPVLSRLASYNAGLPFVGEWTDEAIGAISPQAGERVRNAQDAMRVARPGQDAALRLAGGVVGSLPAVALAPAAAAAAPNALAARGVLGAVSGAVAAGTEGAVSGAGANEQNRLAGMQNGAMWGVGLGTAFGAAAPFVSAGVGNIARYLKGTDTSAISNALSISGDAARAVKAALDGDDLAMAGRNIARGGPNAILAEAGPSTQALAKGTIASGGKATAIMRRGIDERMARGAADARAAIDDAFKPGTAVIPQPPKIGTLYDNAYRKPVDYGSDAGRRIEALISRVPKEEWAKARKLIEMDPDVPEEIKRQFLMTIADDGALTGTTMPSTRVGLDPSRVSTKPMPSVLELDYVTRSLNDTAKAGDGKGALGGNTNQGRIYGNLAKGIRGSLKEAVPEYRQALDFASTEIGIREARDFGATILRPSVTRAQVLDQLKDAPQAERLAAKGALREAVDDTLANTRRIMSRAGSDAEIGEAIKAVKDLTTRSSQGKLATVLGSADARRLAAELDQAATAFELGAALSRNSDTAVNQAVQRSIERRSFEGLGDKIDLSRPVQTAKAIGKMISGSTPEAEIARRAGLYEEIAKALTSIKGPAAQQALQDVQQAIAGQPLNDAQSRQIGHLVTTVLTGGGYQAGRQEIQSLPPR